MATLSNNTFMDRESKTEHIKHLGLIIIVAITGPSLAGAIDTIWHKMMHILVSLESKQVSMVCDRMSMNRGRSALHKHVPNAYI